jgi:hypothetical protein
MLPGIATAPHHGNRRSLAIGAWSVVLENR